MRRARRSGPTFLQDWPEVRQLTQRWPPVTVGGSVAAMRSRRRSAPVVTPHIPVRSGSAMAKLRHSSVTEQVAQTARARAMAAPFAPRPTTNASAPAPLHAARSIHCGRRVNDATQAKGSDCSPDMSHAVTAWSTVKRESPAHRCRYRFEERQPGGRGLRPGGHDKNLRANC